LGDERRKKEKRVCHVGPTLTVASGSYSLNDHIPPTTHQARPSLKHTPCLDAASPNSLYSTMLHCSNFVFIW
jgi:hypothetical protein